MFISDGSSFSYRYMNLCFVLFWDNSLSCIIQLYFSPFVDYLFTLLGFLMVNNFNVTEYSSVFPCDLCTLCLKEDFLFLRFYKYNLIFYSKSF